MPAARRARRLRPVAAPLSSAPEVEGDSMRRSMMRLLVAGLTAGLLAGLPALAQTAPPPVATAAKPTMHAAPARRATEGFGPYRKLVIRGVTLIDGTGAPPRGPVDI